MAIKVDHGITGKQYHGQLTTSFESQAAFLNSREPFAVDRKDRKLPPVDSMKVMDEHLKRKHVVADEEERLSLLQANFEFWSLKSPVIVTLNWLD